MLWAAIEPFDYTGKRLADLSSNVPPAQYKKARLYLRAVTEAVCSGTLPFMEAWEEHDDNHHGAYSRKIDFPELPDQTAIQTHLTRVGQAAFLKWAQSKNMPSYRQSVLQSKKAQLPTTAQAENQPAQSVPLLLPMPAFLDPSHPLSPVELRACIEVWEIVVSTGAHEKSKSVKDAMRAALDVHPEHRSLSTEAKKRISVVANWNKDGGATKTPSQAKPPTPQA